MKMLKIEWEYLKRQSLKLLFSLGIVLSTITPCIGEDRPVYSLKGKYLGVATDDGYLIDSRGRQQGYVTGENQYLDKKATLRGYLDGDMLYDTYGGKPLELDYNDE